MSFFDRQNDPVLRLFKFNPYHDKAGRFTSGGNAGGSDEPTGAKTGGVVARSKATRALSKDLSTLTTNRYFDSIPLKDIFRNASNHGYEAVDEDGQSWEGILTGREGRTIIDLKNKLSGKIDNGIALSWYKMDSGKYEITAYATGGKVER